MSHYFYCKQIMRNVVIKLGKKSMPMKLGRVPIFTIFVIIFDFVRRIFDFYWFVHVVRVASVFSNGLKIANGAR